MSRRINPSAWERARDAYLKAYAEFSRLDRVVIIRGNKAESARLALEAAKKERAAANERLDRAVRLYDLVMKKAS